MKLYPNFKPLGIKAEWEHSSMSRDSAGDLLRRNGIDPAWGDPTEAVAWFADIYLRVLVADYANGRRVTLRRRASTSRLEVVTPEETPA